MNLFKRFIYKFKKLPYSIGTGTYGVTHQSIKSFRKDDSISIGNYCSIAGDVTFLLSGEHNYKHISTYPFFDRSGSEKITYKDTFKKGNITIGNDVWIGHGAIILSGVTISDGAVVGAGTVVSKDVPPYAIVAGNPFKILKYRFEENQINALLSISWWYWEEDLIQQRKEDFYMDIEYFIVKYFKKDNGNNYNDFRK